MRLDELKAGDVVIVDDGFACIRPGVLTVNADDDGKLYIPCDEGRHYLDVDFNDPALIVGLKFATSCPAPVSKDTIAKRLQTEFDNWFAKLQELSTDKLDPEDWTGRWYDGYTPSDALAAGPEDDD